MAQISNKLNVFMLTIFCLVALSYAQKDNYLIVVAEQYQNNSKLEEFITFRNEVFNVSVVTVSEAGGTKDAIKSYIKNLYNGAGSLGYVLFIGQGKTELPCFTASTSAGTANTFHPYGDVEGDSDMDIAVGCFFVRSATDLENMINKTMHTERSIDSYPKEQIMFSVYADNDDNLVRLCGIMRDRYWEQPENSEMEYATSWMMPERGKGQSSGYYKSDFLNAVNSNSATFIAYQGHGSTTGWTDQTNVTTSDVNNLSNDEVYPFVFSHACVTGSFHNSSKCFGETWTTSENGAVAFYGSSVNSSYYQKQLNAGSACAIAQRPEITKIGDLFVFAKKFVRDTTIPGFSGTGFGTPNMNDENMYNLFGDPGLDFRTNPVAIAGGHKNISSVNESIAVNVLDRSSLNLSLKEPGKYSMVISSLNGRTIARLNKTFSSAGTHTVAFNSVIPNGVYIVKIKGENITTSKKLSFMK